MITIKCLKTLKSANISAKRHSVKRSARSRGKRYKMLATKMKSCLLIIVALKISLLESRPVPDLFGMVNSLLGGVGSMLGGAIQSPAGMLGGGAQFPTSMPTMYPSMVAPQQLPQFLSTQYVQGQPVQPLQMQPQSPQSNMNQLEFARQLLSTSDNWNIWKPPQTGLVGAAQQLFLGAENFVSSMLNAFRGLIVGPQPQQYPYPNAFM